MSKKNLKVNAETEALNRNALAEHLTKAQTALEELQKCDASAAAHAYALGAELAAISGKKLFKSTEEAEGKRYKSFRKFVEDKLNISEQYAYMLIKAAKVQDVLTEAGAAPAGVPEKLLRKLTKFVGKQNDRIVALWKLATHDNAEKLPTDKALNDAVQSEKQQKKAPGKKSAARILNAKKSNPKEIIGLLERVISGKETVSAEQLATLKEKLAALCDKAGSKKNNND